MVFGVLGFFGANRRESRGICGVGLATAREICGICCFEFFKNYRFDIELVSARKIGQILLSCSASLHAHRCSLELFGAFDVGLCRHHEALSVVIGDCGLVKP